MSNLQGDSSAPTTPLLEESVSTAKRAGLWNLPNLLTLSRAVLAVVFFGLVAYDFYAAAIAVLAVAAITDWLDGYLARRWDLCSPFGRQFDPLVDKLLVCGSYIYLVAIPFERTGLAAWMVAVIVLRELIVQGLRSAIEGKGVAFGARWAGKVKTVFQFASLILILLVLHLGGSAWLERIRDVATWTAVGLTITSGVMYIRLARGQLRDDLF